MRQFTVRPKRRTLTLTGVKNYLTQRQLDNLSDKFSCSNLTVKAKILEPKKKVNKRWVLNEIQTEAARMLRCHVV
jgi:hypothetical protein